MNFQTKTVWTVLGMVQKKVRNTFANLKFHKYVLLIIIQFLWLAPTCYGSALIINGTKDWILDLTAFDRTTALTNGIEIRNGGTLNISNQGSLSFIPTTGTPHINVLSGGTLNITNSTVRFADEVVINGDAFFQSCNIEFDLLLEVDGGSLESLDGVIDFNAGVLLQNAADMLLHRSTSLSTVTAQCFNDFDVESGSTIELKTIEARFTHELLIKDGLLKLDNAKLTLSTTEESTNRADGEIILTNSSTLDVQTMDLNCQGSLTSTNSTIIADAKIKVTGGGDMTLTSSTMEVGDNLEIFLSDATCTFNSSFLKFGLNARIHMASSCGNSISASGTDFERLGSATWKGILMDGAGTSCLSGRVETHFDIKPTADGSGNCDPVEWAGVLASEPSKVIMDNCSFSDAEIAINSDDNPGGGIVRLRECDFLNCKKGVRIAGYDREEPSANYVMTSDFTWDDQYLFSKAGMAHIELFELDNAAVNIGGCRFFNLITDQEIIGNRGIGILATNSTFNVSKDGDKCCGGENGPCPDNCFADPGKNSRKNVFDKLGFGIKADMALQNSNVALHENQFACRFSEFTDCAVGISLENGKDILIGGESDQASRTIFKTTTGTLSAYFDANLAGSALESVKGIQLTSCSGARIYNNTFDWTDVEFVESIVMESPDLTQTSFIRSNEFSHADPLSSQTVEAVIGINLYGNNNFLDITCNEFSKQYFDIRVNSGATLNDLPDMFAHDPGKLYSKNIWTAHAISTTGDPATMDWRTNSTASNIFNASASNILTIRDGASSIGAGGDNLKFANGTFVFINNINPLNTQFFPNSECGPNNECVDCSTNCDQLTIKQVTGPVSVPNHNPENTKIQIFPNPTNLSFKILLPDAAFGEKLDLVIMNVNGAIVYNQTVINASKIIAVEPTNLEDGMYFVQVTGHFGKVSAKLYINE